MNSSMKIMVLVALAICIAGLIDDARANHGPGCNGRHHHQRPDPEGRECPRWEANRTVTFTPPCGGQSKTCICQRRSDRNPRASYRWNCTPLSSTTTTNTAGPTTVASTTTNIPTTV